MAIGLFGYFKFELNKNDLVGTYLNNGSCGLHNEKAIRTGIATGGFTGTYDTKYKDGNEQKSAILSISSPNTIGEYTLRWTESITVIYEGKGIIEKGNLTGYYHRNP